MQDNTQAATPVVAYCVKCKEKKEMTEATEVEMKGKGGVKRRAMKGKCPSCGTSMFRILGKA
jgi:uncharacterized OB-fold protein